MELFWQEMTEDWPELGHILTLLFRLALAALVGALPGLQREMKGTAAGLRTHMLVSLGSAIFVLAAIESVQAPRIRPASSKDWPPALVSSAPARF